VACIFSLVMFEGTRYPYYKKTKFKRLSIQQFIYSAIAVHIVWQKKQLSDSAGAL